jgi:glutamyl-tRNA synthetase
VNKAGAKFDPEKTKWFNQQYLKKKTDAELAEMFLPQVEQHGFKADRKFIEGVCRLVKEKAHLVNEFWDLGSFFFIAPEKYDETVVAKKWNANARSFFTTLKDEWNKQQDFSHANLESVFKSTAASTNTKPGDVMQMLRVVITGLAGGPALFETIELLGKEEAMSRMQRALEKLPA